MTGAGCVLLPLLLAGAHRWLPLRWLPPAVAAATLALACSLFWTGGGSEGWFGGWLLADRLAVLGTLLSGVAFLAAAAAAALDATDATPRDTALVAGCINLALLSDGAGLTVVAAGAAVVAAVHGLRLPAPGALLAIASCGMGLAVFGLAVLGAGTAPALGSGWPSLSWSALPGAGPNSDGLALGVGFVCLLLGLGCACTLLPAWAAARGTALPRAQAMLAGPLGAVWLVVALRLRGVLDGNGQAVAPGGLLVAVGLGGLAAALLCLRPRDPARLLPGATLAFLAASLAGFGLGGAGATAAGLLHLTLGCLALTAAATGSWPATLGAAALAGLPPLGLFASGFALLTEAVRRAPALAVPLGVALLGVALAALRFLPPPGSPSPAARVGWIGLALTLAGAWAMPAGTAAWMQGIAAAAR